jgi:hypothetical protein
MGIYNRATGPDANFQIYDGEIQDVLNSPSGASDANTSRSWSAYSAGSDQAAMAAFYDQDTANFGAGIGAAIYGTNVGVWQIGFAPHIMKVDTQNLTLNYLLNWSRKTIP